jgi:hypothetical protein
MIIRRLMVLLVCFGALSGCSTFKGLTGQQDNTVLPGQREDVLPPDQQTARDPIVTGQQPEADTGADAPQQACDPNLPDCLAPIDQDAPGQ